MKIKYTSKYLPSWQQQKSLTDEEELFITQLENDKEFEEEVLRLRRKFNIPKDGWPEEKMGDRYYTTILDEFFRKTAVLKKEKDYKHLKSIDILDDSALFSYYSKSLCQSFNLHDSWVFSFACFIAFNIFPLFPAINQISYIGKESYLRRVIDIYKNESVNNLIIIISQKYTKKHLHDWIDSEWSKGLEKEINQLPKHPYSHIGILNVYKRIVELKKLGKTSQQIADILYEENLGIYGHESIKPMYNRYQKYLNSLKSKKG